MNIDIIFEIRPQVVFLLSENSYAFALQNEIVLRSLRSLAAEMRTPLHQGNFRLIIVNHCTQPEVADALVVAQQSFLKPFDCFVIPGDGARVTVASSYTLALPRTRGELVYIVRGDFLYEPKSMKELIECFDRYAPEIGLFKLAVSPHDNPLIYNDQAAGSARIVRGPSRHWRQSPFFPFALLAHHNLIQHNWDLFEESETVPEDNEFLTLNRIWSERQFVLLTPMPSMAARLANVKYIDSHVEWKNWWDSLA